MTRFVPFLTNFLKTNVILLLFLHILYKTQTRINENCSIIQLQMLKYQYAHCFAILENIQSKYLIITFHRLNVKFRAEIYYQF